MGQCNEIIHRAMQQLNSLPSHPFRNPTQLFRTFLVVSRRNRLADEAEARKAHRVTPLFQLRRRKPVTVGRVDAVGIRFGEPGGTDAAFNLNQLRVDRSGDAAQNGTCERHSRIVLEVPEGNGPAAEGRTIYLCDSEDSQNTPDM